MTIEAMDDGRFLAKGRADDEVVEVCVDVDERFLEQIGLSDAAGADVATATIAYLLTHQRVDELPPNVDLEDVAAAYDDFESELRRAVAGG